MPQLTLTAHTLQSESTTYHRLAPHSEFHLADSMS